MTKIAPSAAVKRVPGRLLPSWMIVITCGVAVLTAAVTGPGAVAGSPSPHSPSVVPLKWMPPGANASPVPSDEIFPPQTLTIRFDHRLHSQQLKQRCEVCHGAAARSTKAADRLMPNPATTCDSCHNVDHSTLGRVVAGQRSGSAAAPRPENASGQCTLCHLGENAGVGGRVAKLVIPPPKLRMNHQAHLDRNISCPHCHGVVQELGMATREQLPRMAGCFACHAMSGAARGEAHGDCTTCHLATPSGRLETALSTGTLKPPTWLHGAAHGPDWRARHKDVAGGNSGLCASCHANRYCTDCHDGKVRPRDVHPGDFLSAHPQAARQDSPRCVSCHQLQTFCGDCHRRTGVARDAPSANRLAGRRFHPAPAVWSNGPRSPQHHSWEAQRNLNACVACHTERDCVTCHATKGIRGGAGVNPHPAGFASKCGLARQRNARSCLVCHPSNDPVVRQCR